ncbi:DUF3809 domain-containing protein [Deinococcus metallilatus]|uniref:DUF3809 domain-containing protein n=1 Tax=Deinococcus metallilatus TaxID=1211322 RepID=A0AAJ5F0T5_9DEIO|nr:DUF3809 domain-containing protein [Deinococcus metallilatus]MBB5296094.1 hypothetical protein [Deinococcus metallilatus]QBY09849.1 DUF3809 domain-containing protein [Deinococcus metallilatus]RXJ08846.1 DUF3809 domain-containing protein [Deinococcus metallilatus]TLK23326.1 DUF3809 domain-containing protein [Deinococcus metallilatus]GMA13960.1 hypothetical protein GCM10025871_02910 [Deinococcus metallilatus]
MLIEAQQSFTLAHPGGRAAALAFVRDAGKALARVRFLRGLSGDTRGVSGELIVPVPVLGEVDLPFHSLLTLTPDGATLTPQPVDGERAWVEVAGQAEADGAGTVTFLFHFRAHLYTPQAEGWGGAAFEKMVRAAAARTLERVAAELPAGIAAAMEADAERAGP